MFRILHKNPLDWLLTQTVCSVPSVLFSSSYFALQPIRVQPELVPLLLHLLKLRFQLLDLLLQANSHHSANQVRIV